METHNARHVWIRSNWDAYLGSQPGHTWLPSPLLSEISCIIAGSTKQLRDIEFLILAASAGHWEAAEMLAEVLPLNLYKSTPLAFRAAAIMLAIRDSWVRPEATFRRLIPGQKPLVVEEGHDTVVYLPLALRDGEMAWRRVPETLRGRLGLVPWNWTWDAYMWGYLIPAARRNAEALQEISPSPALSLDYLNASVDDEGTRLDERIAGAANTPAEAFQNIIRDTILKRLSPRDRALYIVFVEHGYQLKEVSALGISRNTLSQQISRMRESAREIRDQASGGIRYVFDAFEKIQGFSPLGPPGAPEDPLPWDHVVSRPGLKTRPRRYPADELTRKRLKRLEARRNNKQALRGGSAALDTPKLPSGKLVHPPLTQSELRGLQKELAEAYRPASEYHPYTCACGSAEELRGGACGECRVATVITETKEGDGDLSAMLIAKQNEVLEDVRDRLDILLAGLEDTISVLVWKFPDHEDEIRGKASEIFSALRD